MAYNFDPTKPAGTQPMSDIDDAVRDSRAGTVAMVGTEHTVDVSDPTAVTAVHKNDFLATAMIKDNAVTTPKIADAAITTAKLAANAAIPPGAVMPFAQNTAPTGWLECNGAAVNRTTYAALFTAIGTTFGNGNGSTTFNVPDLRGEFIRGWDHSRGVDAGRALGSAQTDALKAHNHTVGIRGETGSGSIMSLFSRTPGADVTFTTSTTGDAETRPRNVALMYCIKH
jgi:microcystin-dependent protein